MSFSDTIKWIMISFMVIGASSTIANAIRYHADTIGANLNHISQECRHY